MTSVKPPYIPIINESPFGPLSQTPKTAELQSLHPSFVGTDLYPVNESLKIKNRVPVSVRLHEPKRSKTTIRPLQKRYIRLDAKREIELGTTIQHAKKIVFAALQEHFPEITQKRAKKSGKLKLTVENLTPYFEEHKQMIDVLKTEGSEAVQSAILAWEEARKEFVLHNIYLVKRLAIKLRNEGVPLDSIISAGYVGLCRAADKFDPKSGFRFSSYAKFWIRAEMFFIIYQTLYPYKYSGKEIWLLLQINKAIDTLSSVNPDHKKPTPLEIAHETCLKPQTVKEILLKYQRSTSLDILINKENENSAHLVDCIKDPSSNDRDERIFQEALKDLIIERLHAHLETREKKTKRKTGLNDRDLQILIARYGLDGEKEKSHAEIAEQFNFSKTRAKVLIDAALKKLALDPLLQTLNAEGFD